MQLQLLVFAMVPALAFAVMRSRAERSQAIAAAVAVAALECAVTCLRLGRLEPLSIASLVLFIVLGALAVQREDDRLFALQPVVLDLLLAVVFAWAFFANGVPLLAVILDDVVRLSEILPTYQRGYATLYATTLSRTIPLVFVLHALWTGWAAWSRSLQHWALVRVFGFYGLLAILFLLERVLGLEP